MRTFLIIKKIAESVLVKLSRNCAFVGFISKKYGFHNFSLDWSTIDHFLNDLQIIRIEAKLWSKAKIWDKIGLARVAMINHCNSLIWNHQSWIFCIAFFQYLKLRYLQKSRNK